MADAILMAGGTGGATSDDVTATKAHVLQGYTALTSDSNDEPIQGTMPNRGTWNTASEVVNSPGENMVHVRFEEGYYHKDGQFKPTVKIPYAVLTNVTGIDANKMLDTLTISGVRGTIPVRGYHGPNVPEMFYYQPDGGYVIRVEEGYYHKSGQWKPYVVATPVQVKSAVNYHPEKTLSDTTTCNEQGQVKMVDTSANNYTGHKARNFGLDPGRGVFWMEFANGNAYYYRPDNTPHVVTDSANLGSAGADSVLQWQTATSQNGVKFEGTIPRWICTTGDVISAVDNNGFAWDDSTGANRGRGIVARIPNGFYIQGANYVFLPSPNLYPPNIRAGVNINGVTGTMPDLSTGRTVFNGATFDGTIATGVATKGFYLNGTYFAYSLVHNYGYAGINGIGMNFNLSTGYPALKSRRIGCVLSQSIDLTPFRQIIVSYRTITTIKGNPYVTLEVHVSRVSTRRLIDVAGAGKVDAIDLLRQGTASPAIIQTGQIVLNVADINEQAFISFGAYCNSDRSSDVFSGTVQITKIEFLN